MPESVVNTLLAGNGMVLKVFEHGSDLIRVALRKISLTEHVACNGLKRDEW